MAKAKPKASAPKPDPAIVKACADKVLARLEGQRTADTVAPGAVGAPMALSFDAVKGLVAPLTKNALDVLVRVSGSTLEDLAASQADLLDDFVPDSVYELIEKIARRMNSGDYPHVVGGETS